MKSKSKNLKLASLSVVILAIIYAAVWYFTQSLLATDKVCHDTKCFVVEIADTDEERQQGLMHRESLGEKKGMLFVFQKEDIYGFWMKNTLIPLDMIRIDSDYNIVDIQTAKPCKTENCRTYTPKGKSTYVLEINAGISKKNNIRIGDKLNFKLK